MAFAGVIGPFERVDHQQQGERAFLVHRGSQQMQPVVDGRIGALAAGPPQVRHRHADEDVALRILTGTGLAEALQDRHTRSVSPRAQQALDPSAHTILFSRTPTP